MSPSTYVVAVTGAVVVAGIFLLLSVCERIARALETIANRLVEEDEK